MQKITFFLLKYLKMRFCNLLDPKNLANQQIRKSAISTKHKIRENHILLPHHPATRRISRRVHSSIQDQMESLFPSSSSKKKHGFLASIMATNHPSSGTSEDDSEELSILGLVTSGEFSAVGQPAASGTCASVHQTLVEAVAAEATPCKAKLCLQSAQVGDAAASAQRTLPERFTTMDEVKAISNQTDMTVVSVQYVFLSLFMTRFFLIIQYIWIPTASRGESDSPALISIIY